MLAPSQHLQHLVVKFDSEGRFFKFYHKVLKVFIVKRDEGSGWVLRYQGAGCQHLPPWSCWSAGHDKTHEFCSLQFSLSTYPHWLHLLVTMSCRYHDWNNKQCLLQSYSIKILNQRWSQSKMYGRSILPVSWTQKNFSSILLYLNHFLGTWYMVYYLWLNKKHSTFYFSFLYWCWSMCTFWLWCNICSNKEKTKYMVITYCSTGWSWICKILCKKIIPTKYSN